METTNKFLDFCKTRGKVGFIRQIPDDCWDDYIIAKNKKLVNEIITPYGGAFELKYEEDI